MGKLYAGQTKLRIRLTVNQDITGATAILIKYRKPDGTEGSFVAFSESDTLGIIYYDINVDRSDIPAVDYGEWMFWAHITFADSKDAPGEAIWEHFYEEPA